jgi:hypothetical protein
MLKRVATIAILAAALPAISAAPAIASRSCGGSRIDGPDYFGPYRVVVTHGNVSCRTARALIQALVDGKGKRGGNPNGAQAEMYVKLPGGWRCGSGAGGVVSCARGKRTGDFYAEMVSGENGG